MTSLAPHMEAFLREYLVASVAPADTLAIRTPTASNVCSNSPRRNSRWRLRL